MGRRVAFRALVVIGGLVACRDATPPFAPTDRVDESANLPRQLTFASTDDRSPVWHARTEAVFYATEGFPPFVEAPGLLLSVPAGGGSSVEVLPGLQFPGGPRDRFSAPVPSPDGERLAWVDLRSVLTSNVCPGTVVMCSLESSGLGPRLSEVRVRVTGLSNEGTVSEVVTALPADGVQPLPPGSGLTQFQTRVHPFQVLFQVEGSAVFRPSWSPDGDRLVFSDGLQLVIWTIDGAAPRPIPGTEDAVHAAWSPDGTWIAFTRLLRGDPIEMACTHSVPLGPVCMQERTEWPIVGRVVTVVRPDGSGLTELGGGDDPAWTPDTDSVVIRRDGSLWIVGSDGSGATQIPGTEGGREPAVSPDGDLVAYARIDPTFMTHDLWVVALPGGGS